MNTAIPGLFIMIPNFVPINMGRYRVHDSYYLQSIPDGLEVGVKP